MLTLLLALTAFAGPRPIVAVGDGLVVGSQAEPDKDRPGSWVAVLADCLDERLPGRFSVIDQSWSGATPSEVRDDAWRVAEAEPALVLVGVGAGELSSQPPDRQRFRTQLGALVAELRGQSEVPVMLVGVIPPTVTQLQRMDPSLQASMDKRAVEWNEELVALARSMPAVTHVDLLRDWPSDPVARAPLTEAGTRLTDRGHARVAAMVCDAVVSWDGDG